jgi:hypothetical protein
VIASDTTGGSALNYDWLAAAYVFPSESLTMMPIPILSALGSKATSQLILYTPMGGGRHWTSPALFRVIPHNLSFVFCHASRELDAVWISTLGWEKSAP